METLVSFQLTVIAEAKRSPSSAQFREYRESQRTAVIGLLGKADMDVVNTSYPSSTESARRSGVSTHTRDLYPNLFATAASMTQSAVPSQSASLTWSAPAFTGVTHVSVTLHHVVRLCPEVLGWPMLTHETLCLVEPTTRASGPKPAYAGRLALALLPILEGRWLRASELDTAQTPRTGGDHHRCSPVSATAKGLVDGWRGHRQSSRIRSSLRWYRTSARSSGAVPSC